MAAADIKVENDGDSSSALPNGQNKEEASSNTAVADDAGVPAKKIKTENGEGYVQCSQLPQWMMTEMEICEIVACGFIACLVLLKAKLGLTGEIKGWKVYCQDLEHFLSLQKFKLAY